MSNFEQILMEIGEFGLFQKLLVAALCIPSIFLAFDLIGQVFTGMNFPHHCNTDWIFAQATNLTEERQKNLAIPLNDDGKYESCEMFTPVDLETSEAYGVNATTGCINGSVYETPKGASSIVTEFDLVRSTLRGPPLTPQLLLCGVAAAFSPNVYVYMVLKFLSGIAVSGILNTVFVIGAEWTDSSKFALCTIICQSTFSLGLMIISGVAYLVRNWRILQLVLYCPLVLVLGLFYLILPESARWLITHGKKEEAIKEIQRAAKMNGRKVPEDLLNQVELVERSKRRSMLDIFRISYLRKRALIMSYIWFAAILVYYGLSLSVDNFGVDIYVTQFVFGVVEIPARLGSLLFIQCFGRRISQAGVLFLGGFACLGILVIPKGNVSMLT
ncbi:solute carrier family 22 member 13-like [Solea senegalensis]|uniref:Solute carrier family 22 member 13-like n=1 Tax=Solea senegalensis TaxID=28829 RepID=A0AAV6T5K7_SOLSE|nr:solute carrier family 22 member 13-like [Solea senegalensis]